MTHITDTSTVTIGQTYGLLVQVNAALTGTITVADSRGTQAVITNPAVGNAFRYFGLVGSVTVVCSAGGDITVSALNHQG